MEDINLPLTLGGCGGGRGIGGGGAPGTAAASGGGSGSRRGWCTGRGRGQTREDRTLAHLQEVIMVVLQT